MTTAKRIRELTEALVSSGGKSSETLDRLDLNGRPSQTQLVGWAEVQAALPVVGIISISAMDVLGEVLDLASLAASADAQELRIQVVKSKCDTTVFCLTSDGVASVFVDAKAAAAVL